VNVFDTNDARHDDVVLGCLPLFHTFGQTVSMNGLSGVPTMYVGLLEAASTADRLPDLRLCVSGGASLPVAVLERFTAIFHSEIFEGYGLSETSPVATTNQPAFGTRHKVLKRELRRMAADDAKGA
jgi:long-chain acyl-CoA synthetase